MKTRIEMLKEIGVSDADAEQYLPHLEEALPKHGIADSRLRLAHFFAQVLHESGCMRFDMENLNYSSDALRRVFGKYFATKEEADAYARNPERIANRGLSPPHGRRTRRAGMAALEWHRRLRTPNLDEDSRGSSTSSVKWWMA